MPDLYVEIPDAEREAADGSFYFDVSIQKGYGIISATNDDGCFLRVFEVDPETLRATPKESLKKMATLDGISGNRHDLSLPEGVDPDKIKQDLLDRMQARNVRNHGQVDEAAVMTLLQHYGMKGKPALFISERADTQTCSYKNVCTVLTEAFPEGPESFKNNPVKQARALTGVKEDLNASGISDDDLVRTDKSYSGALTGYNPVVRDLRT